MKIKEANDLIRSQIEAGATTEEIIATLMNEEKIGTTKPSEEKIVEMIDKVLEGDDPDGDAPSESTTSNQRLYEKWEVKASQSEKGLVIGEKQSKLKDVLIDEETANRLNQANYLCGRGYIIRYYLKK